MLFWPNWGDDGIGKKAGSKIRCYFAQLVEIRASGRKQEARSDAYLSNLGEMMASEDKASRRSRCFSWKRRVEARMSGKIIENGQDNRLMGKTTDNGQDNG